MQRQGRMTFCARFRTASVGHDIDDVTWKDDIVTVPPVIKDGDLLLPTGPGWGADVNEEFVRGASPTLNRTCSTPRRH
jgi:L-alanine-DL-glutamate epimerase-like enolase superfamily enzyme